MEKPRLESVHNFLSERNPALDAFFAPSTVAVIGATENPGSVGRTLLRNLVSSPFGGTVFPVHPTRTSVLGIQAYPTVSRVPAKVDLAVIATPAPSVPGIIRQCVEAGVGAAIIISAGFKETGAAGVELERQVLVEARRGPLRIIGPNCLGVMNPRNGFNATFAAALARPGNVGFISQSGALLTAILDWSLKEWVGFSAFVSVGSMLDVNWGDLIDYLGDDPNTQSIVIYMESIGDARGFLSAAREVALSKPIIVIKPGRTEGAAKAAASHTGSLTGSDEVLDAAFRRCGVLRVDRISDLFHMAEVLGKQPKPRGSRLTIITNAGGPGVLATDALLESGGTLAPLSPATTEILNKTLPAAWSHNNPIDVLGDAGPDRYAKTLELAAKDPNTDGLLVILTPQAMTDAALTAQALIPFGQTAGKPVLASWMGGGAIEAGSDILRRAQIPVFGYPDTAARAFTYMWRYSDNLRALYETPEPTALGEENADYLKQAAKLLGSVRKAGRTLLTEVESKTLLTLYGIPTTETRVARSEAEALSLSEELKYPVVLKIFSETITHKTDVGGVQLNVRTPDSVRKAYAAIKAAVKAKDFLGVTVQPMVRQPDSYELIIGSSLDPQFGPVLLFGAGGSLVEVFKDRALALPPLNTTLARRLMERTKIYAALKGVRGRKPIDFKALEQLLVHFSQLVVEQRWIREIDINPLLASPQGLLALDARVVLHDATAAESELPKPAIRPYPMQYVGTWKLKKGARLTIRPIRQQDEPLMVKFHEALSERSVYLRYFQSLNLSQRVTHERLLRRCFIDYDREIALAAEGKDPKTGEPALLGICRLIKDRVPGDSEFSILVSDDVQRQGLGAELMKRLIAVAHDEGVKTLHADILRENAGMLHLCRKLGFLLDDAIGEPIVRARLTLTQSSSVR